MEDIMNDALEDELLSGSDEEPQNEANDEKAENQNQQAENENAEAQAVVPKKRIVRCPLPKLDPERLCGPRGIPILPELFGKMEFKGKGHEVEDLDNLMAKYEHWAHRMFPKLPFDTILERIEKLGSRKPVQVCATKMRFDLPILNDDFVSQTNDSDEESAETSTNKQSTEGQNSTRTNDVFDDLLRSYDTETPSQQNQSNQSNENISTTNPQVTLTDEQKERIKRNKELAAHKRKEALERKAQLLNNATEVEQSEAGSSSRMETESETQEDAAAEERRKEIRDRIQRNKELALKRRREALERQSLLLDSATESEPSLLDSITQNEPSLYNKNCQEEGISNLPLQCENSSPTDSNNIGAMNASDSVSTPKGQAKSSTESNDIVDDLMMDDLLDEEMLLAEMDV